jgi:hypothetical protein
MHGFLLLMPVSALLLYPIEAQLIQPDSAILAVACFSVVSSSRFQHF